MHQYRGFIEGINQPEYDINTPTFKISKIPTVSIAVIFITAILLSAQITKLHSAFKRNLSFKC